MRKQSLYDIKNSNAQYDQGLCVHILNNSLMNDPMHYYVSFELHMNYGNSETSGVENEFIVHLYFYRAPYGQWHLVWLVVLLKWCTLLLQGKLALNFSPLPLINFCSFQQHSGFSTWELIIKNLQVQIAVLIYWN